MLAAATMGTMVVGGIHERTAFYNVGPVNNFEFVVCLAHPHSSSAVFPPIFSQGKLPEYWDSNYLLQDTIPGAFALLDNWVFMITNNLTIIYDIERTILPDIPSVVRVTNPFDGTATLLLSPPGFVPEILVCGGTTHCTSDQIQPANFSSQDPASSQCSRMTTMEQGIKKSGRSNIRWNRGCQICSCVTCPNGKVIIVNGGQTGYTTFTSNAVKDPVGKRSDADHPAFTPSLYTHDALPGKRISNKGMPTTNIARLYHYVAV
ncbi:hypothetical protein CPC08DRAFT_212372 [Agrocybe pediades]|nr:hypothetical protein CPC08DRAFT_212372 [Agrocybe pediades]